LSIAFCVAQKRKREREREEEREREREKEREKDRERRRLKSEKELSSRTKSMVLNSSTLSTHFSKKSAKPIEDEKDEAAVQRERCQTLLQAMKKKSPFPSVKFTCLLTNVPTGQAVVFGGKWKDSSADREVDVAIKFYLEDDESKYMEAFKRELFLLRVIGEHPHILKLLTHFESPTPTFIFPLVTGGGLDGILEKRALPPAVVCQYGLQIAKSLQHMHLKKVAHLDLKSANVLIDKANVAVLADFGYSSTFDGDGEDEIVLKGTPPFMAPEVWTGGKGDLSKVDVYAFGMFLYEMLTGQYPWINLIESSNEQKWNHDIQTNVQRGKRPTLDKNWPKSLVKMIEECWASSPSHRPSMREIAERLGKMVL
jgi:hypothetical protein